MHPSADRVPAAGSRPPDNGHVNVGTLAVAPGLAVRADRPIPDRAPASLLLFAWHEVILAFMAAINGSHDVREWLRSQGEAPSRRGALSKRHMEMYWDAHPDQRPDGEVGLLPGPDDDLSEYEDLGIMLPDGPESNGDAPGDEGVGEILGGPREPLTPDPEPAHGRKEWRKPPAKTRGKPVRVTAGVRNDINAKISFALEIPGRVWQARDPVCGSAFVEQRPAISDALTEIVCQSADLIAWFTGSGGQFMLWLNLAAACWPVATIVMAHHVYHTIEPGQEGEALAPDYGSYAA